MFKKNLSIKYKNKAKLIVIWNHLNEINNIIQPLGTAPPMIFQ